jgi:general secretion pathway protein A
MAWRAMSCPSTSSTACAWPAPATPLFEPAAVEALYQASHGLPRKVNRVAHYALSAAALAKARQITAEHLQCAVEEVQ